MDLSRRDLCVHGRRLALLAAAPLWECSRRTDDSAALRVLLGSPAAEALALAARAPSGHNTQPWTVRIADRQHWIIGIEKSRRLPAVDPTGRETLLSLGAFLENLAVALAHVGYAIEYRIIAASALDTDVIDLRLRRTGPLKQQLDRIKLRRTVRNCYLASEIKSADLASVTGPDEDFHYFPRGSAAARYLAEGTVEANRRQAFRDPAQAELARWIRWSSSDGAKYRNGLTPAGMEIEGLAGWYVSHFYHRADALSQAFRETTIRQVTERVGQGGGWLVLSSAGTGVPALIETGRKVERMWLRVREKKLAIHPMTQMLEEAPWREQAARNIGVSGVPQFLLRIGYLNRYPDPASLRMPPSWVVHF